MSLKIINGHIVFTIIDFFKCHSSTLGEYHNGVVTILSTCGSVKNNTQRLPIDIYGQFNSSWSREVTGHTNCIINLNPRTV